MVFTTRPTISLPEAARRLGKSWHQTYRLILNGSIEAEHGVSGRWEVSLASVDRYQNLMYRRRASDERRGASVS